MDQQSDRVRDDGFSLIETIVAVVLMAGLLMSAAGLMIRSTQTNRGVQGKQAAVAVAREVMENVRAVPATFSEAIAATASAPAVPSTSKLVAGRSKSDVVAQWAAAAAAGVDVSQTYTGSGATARDSHAYAPALAVSEPSPALVPRQQVRVNNQTYTVDTLVGTCVRQRTGETCTKSASGEELFRVVVRVTWSPSGARRCGTGACSYVLTTLVDPTIQPTFNVLAKPVCLPDPGPSDPVISTPAGQQREILVLGNDSGDFPLQNAVELSVGPVKGVADYDTDRVKFLYTPMAGFSGTDTFTYACIDVNNTRSDLAAAVTVKVLPVGVTDAVAARSAVAQSVSPLVNDKGSSLALTSVGAPSPSGPTATVNGSSISLTSNAPGTFTVPYTGKDAENQVYTGSIVLTVTTPPIKASDDPVTLIRGRQTLVPVTGNDTVSDLTQVSVSAVPIGSSATGQVSPPGVLYTATASGPQTFQYTITDVRKQTASAKATVTVLGPSNDEYPIARRNTPQTVDLLANDYFLSTGGVITSLVRQPGSTGGSVSSTVQTNGRGSLTFNTSGTYFLDYTVSFKGPDGVTTTDVGTVKVVVQ